MALVINTNLSALNVMRNLDRNQDTIQVALQRLSTGLRINSAKDDAAGLAISERFMAQINGLNQAARNASDAVSLAQTAEGALDEIANNLQRMRELAVQSANATLSTSDRISLNDEYNELAAEITRVSDATSFNNVAILGTAVTLTFQVGPNPGSTNQIVLSTVNVASASGVASLTAVSLGSATGSAALSALTVVDTAIDTISGIRADFGTIQNRFESVVRSVEYSSYSNSAALSRIRDADFAAETANLVRGQIIEQAGIAALVQANASPQYVLSLLESS
ncbi:MAG: flagellin FliC [Gammaproteobacteria bacterium]|nr:flagellin FliC [Gammaproteobacteria bacterium]